MRTFEVVPETGGKNLEDVRQAAAHLKGQACTFAARHVSDGMSRLLLNRKVAYFTESVIRDVEAGTQSSESAVKKIEKEQQSFYEKSRDNFIKGLGLTAGFAQMTGALMLCGKTSKLICSVVSSTMAVHGVNNTMENTRNFMEDRLDAEGPLKLLYQKTALSVGGTRSDGNIAYGLADIGLSLYSVYRPIPDPKGWRLWYNLDSDFIRAHKATSDVALTLEAGSTWLNIRNIRNELEKDDE